MLRASRGKSGKNGKSIKNRALSVEQLEARQVMAMDVGMNLEWIADYSPAWVFKDAFQQARAWQTQEYNTATRLSTNTSRPAHVDDKGWPTQLDTWTNEQGQVIQQRLLALMFNGAGGVHPAGVYHLEWKGTGTISFLGDGRVLSRTVDSAGTTHLELDVTPTAAGIALRIDTMSSTDPIRDLHVWLPDYNGESFAGQAWRPGADFSPFHPLFIERLAPFESLRFTQMSSAVPSDIVHWSDSRPVDHARQSTFAVDFQNGVSPEYMIELSNELGANPWFNMPHLAQDDYVRRFAELVRDQLDPHLKVYVEWSNEVWNYAPGFEGHVWARDQAAAEGVRIEEIVARETRRDFAIWSEVFAGQEDRLIRTVGGFTAGVGTAGWNEQVLSRMQGQFDALAIAPYISPSRDVRATYTASTTVDQVLADTRANMAPVMTQVRMDADTVRRYESLLGRDLQLLAYEGGTHLDDGNRPYERAFFEANVDPRMHDLMLDYFRELEGAGLDSYMHFKFTDRHVTQLVNDDFGTLSRMDQPLETAPRYTALLDFIAESQTPRNEPPVLVSPGDQRTVEGAQFTLQLAASDPENGRLTYSLDAAPAGATIDPATGLFRWTAIEGPSQFSVTVRVTDDGAEPLSDVKTFRLGVLNAAPTNLAIQGPSTVVTAMPVRYTGTFTDPGIADTHSLAWQVYDATGRVVAGGAGASLNVTPPSTGTFLIRFIVADDDGAMAIATRSVTVAAAALIADPVDGRLTALAVGGTAASDTISVIPAANGAMAVQVNGAQVGVYSPTGRIIAFGGPGNDVISVNSAINRPTELHGGDGDDRLNGGRGPNLLLGDAGNDNLTGGTGRDILIGGTGRDVLQGLDGDDVLIGGSTAFDNRDDVLRLLAAEWNSSRSYADRTAALRGDSASPGFAGRVNGDYFLVVRPAGAGPATVVDDAAADQLHGAAGNDWYLAGALSGTSADQLLGVVNGERVDTV